MDLAATKAALGDFSTFTGAIATLLKKFPAFVEALGAFFRLFTAK